MLIIFTEPSLIEFRKSRPASFEVTMMSPARPASVTARTMPGPASELKPTMPVRSGWPWMIAAVLAATCSTLVPDSSSATTVTDGQVAASASRRPWRAAMKLLAARNEMVPIWPLSSPASAWYWHW